VGVWWTPGRWRRVFSVLRLIERELGLSPGRRSSHLVGADAAIRHGVDRASFRRPVSLMVRSAPHIGQPRRTGCGADVICLGKFDARGRDRFRTFYVDGAAVERTLQVQRTAAGNAAGLEREIPARRVIADHAPELAPRYLGHRTGNGYVYSLEEVERGHHPRSPDEVQALLPQLVAGLRRLHEGVGIEQRSLSSVVSWRFPTRWAEMAAAGLLPPGVATKVAALVRRHAEVPVSLGHGDLVRTNLIATREGSG
jgi:hypothetical protein